MLNLVDRSVFSILVLILFASIVLYPADVHAASDDSTFRMDFDNTVAIESREDLSVRLAMYFSNMNCKPPTVHATAEVFEDPFESQARYNKTNNTITFHTEDVNYIGESHAWIAAHEYAHHIDRWCLTNKNRKELMSMLGTKRWASPHDSWEDQGQEQFANIVASVFSGVYADIWQYSDDVTMWVVTLIGLNYDLKDVIGDIHWRYNSDKCRTIAKSLFCEANHIDSIQNRIIRVTPHTAQRVAGARWRSAYPLIIWGINTNPTL